MFDLKIRGHRSLNKKLNRMGTTVARKAVRPAMHEALVPVVQTAQAHAPVKTGRLRKSIKSAVKNSRRHGIIGMVRTGTRKQLRIPNDAEYYYPSAIELGTRKKSARSFLRLAMRLRRQDALKILGQAIARVVKKL